MVVVGGAMTVLESDCADPYVATDEVKRPFGLILRALDDLKPGKVYLCTGASPRYVLWGHLMTVRAGALGAVGAVVDGYSALVLARSQSTATSIPSLVAGMRRTKGYVVGSSIIVVPSGMPNGTVAPPGDLVFGDLDGVLVVPRDHEEDIIAAALKSFEVRTSPVKPSIWDLRERCVRDLWSDVTKACLSDSRCQ